MVLLLVQGAACKTLAPLEQGEAFQQRGRYHQAIEVYRIYYLEHPESAKAAEALWRIGNIYRLNLKDYKKAMEAYNVLVQRFPESAPALKAQLAMGELAARHLQDYERAAVEYQRIFMGKKFSAKERALAKLESGNAYYALGNYAQARIEYEGVKQLFPESLEARRATLQLAASFDAEGDYDRALNLYREVAKFADEPAPPGQSPPYSKDFAAALKDLAVQGRFGEASCLEELGHYQEALAVFEAVLPTYPSRRVVEIRIERLSARLHNVQR